VCTLHALAEATGQDKVIAALDARMGELYFAAYEKREGAWRTVIEPCLCTAQSAPAVAGSGWFGCGSGFVLDSPISTPPPEGEGLTARYAAQLCGVEAQVVPQAAAIARLAALEFAHDHAVDAALALPLYLRDKVALTTRERAAR